MTTNAVVHFMATPFAGAAQPQARQDLSSFGIGLNEAHASVLWGRDGRKLNALTRKTRTASQPNFAWRRKTPYKTPYNISQTTMWRPASACRYKSTRAGNHSRT